MAINDEEDKLQRANLVRSYAPTVGVGVVGSTPITDQTNLNVAAAMERGDQFSRGFQPQGTVNALRASRNVPDMIGNAVKARQQALAEGLQSGVNPDAPAITISPKTRLQMVNELHALSSVSHQNAIEKAHQTSLAYKQQRDTEAANDYVGFIHDLNGITAPIGSAEHAQAASQVFENHPLALQTTAGREAGMLHARVHDTASSLGTKLYSDQQSALAENPGATIEQSPRGGWRVTKYSADTNNAVHDLRDRTGGMTPAQFMNPEDIHAGTGTGSSFVPKEGGNTIRLTYTHTKSGQTKNVDMTQKEFDDFKARLSPKPQQNAPQGNVAPATATLDANTAKALITEAGGDKERARALAKQRGYSF